MRTKLIGIALGVTFGFVVIAMAQSQNSDHQAPTTPSAAVSASAADPAPPAKAASHSATKAAAKKGLTPDQIYKANCTRCHAEIPTMDARRTATIVKHMRVRANLTEQEARAIFDYLNK